jgi:hypothetical protein
MNMRKTTFGIAIAVAALAVACEKGGQTAATGEPQTYGDAANELSEDAAADVSAGADAAAQAGQEDADTTGQEDADKAEKDGADQDGIQTE